MTRLFWHCLALCAFFATPPVASGQTMVGQSRLAPVALEARCRFADSMLDGPMYLVALGSDPLHASILAEDLARKPANATSVANAVQAKKEVQHQYCEPFPRPQPFCPFDELALEEPLDIEASADAGQIAIANGSEIAWEEPRACYPYPEEVAAVDELQHDEVAQAGSSPTIVMLNQADLPVDFNLARPVRISLLPIMGPMACELPRPSLLVDSAPEIQLADLLPAAEQLAQVQRAFTAMIPATPFECWMDEIVWNVESALAQDGPVRPWLDIRKLGESVVDVSDIAVHSVSDAMRPALPILAQIVEPAPVPKQIAVSELAAAADVLHSAALELEKMAHQLRTWGDDLQRVASADDSIQRR